MTTTSKVSSEPLQWLNYHHLFYFWAVSREGGLSQAAKRLRLSHPTLSVQIRALEDRLGEKLFTKVGRRLVLTETGKVVFRYADEIFSLGREMVDAVAGKVIGNQIRLDVGVVDVVPKLVVRRLLDPALATTDPPIKLVCFEDAFEKLLAELALHSLDIVISDAPLPPGSSIRAFNHLLGETGIAFFGTKALAAKCRRGFPASLANVPMLLPLDHVPLRRSLNMWFDSVGVRPNVVAEFEDSALMKVFGSDGIGVFPSPIAVESEIARQYEVERIGEAVGVRERFYAITMERRIANPAVIAISQAAKAELFANG